MMSGTALLAAGRAARADAPLRFAHAYGEAVLPRPARRVVSLGYNTQDALLAIGVVPVGIRHWYGNYPDGVWPWAQPLLGDAKPVVMMGEVSMEVVAGLAPDLIVGIGSAISAEEYAVLSQIAPVLMQPEGVGTWAAAWQDTTRILGRATGREAEAEASISQTTERFAAARAAHPEWAGKSAVAAWCDGGQTGIFTGDDTRARFLTDLGFITPEAARDLVTQGGFYATLSPEDLSPLDADLLVWISASARATDIADLAMRQTLRAVRDGREIFADEVLSGALSFGSVLSLPYALDLIEPEIVLATDGDPGTVVPSARMAGLVK
ncbi:iron-siderophore ABC transporter substrate-binding protein [Paenirhodobacter populi]|nr:iron-siderophore ABC transporter substrate-binding protein [Sinirhodobacter populi]